jgi:uracil-DNA glycosylase
VNSTDALFYGTRGSHTPRVLIVGEAWGATEEAQRTAFVGESGKLLDRMLRESKVDLDECLFTNLVAARPNDNDFTEFLIPGRGSWRGGVNPTNLLEMEHRRLCSLIETTRPEVILTCGNWPLWALTSHCTVATQRSYAIPTGVASWRGSQLLSDTGIKLVPIYHPAAILRQWPLYYLTKHDISARLFNIDWTRRAEYLISPSYNQLEQWFLDNTRTSDTLAVDVETLQNQTHVVGLASSPHCAVAVPFGHGIYSQDEEAQLRWLINRWLNRPELRLVGQNFAYDVQWLWRDFLVVPRCHFDTMIAQNVLWPGQPRALHYLASMYCQHYRYWKDEGKEWQPGDDLRTMLEYNCMDTTATFEVYEEQTAIAEALGLANQIRERMESWALAVSMMLRGIRVDRSRRQELYDEACVAQHALANRLSYIIPGPPEEKPWYRSPTQTMDLLYRRMKLSPVLHPKTKRPAVDKKALPKLVLQEPLLGPVVELLEEYRSLSVNIQTFLLAPLDEDGRMRCYFDVAGTETFRWASRKNAFGRGANLQNLPSD